MQTLTHKTHTFLSFKVSPLLWKLTIKIKYLFEYKSKSITFRWGKIPTYASKDKKPRSWTMHEIKPTIPLTTRIELQIPNMWNQPWTWYNIPIDSTSQASLVHSSSERAALGIIRVYGEIGCVFDREGNCWFELEFLEK